MNFQKKMFSYIFFLTTSISCFANPVLYRHEQKAALTLPDRFRVVETHPFLLSGSKQFSLSNLAHMLRLYPEKSLIIVDLRGEFHGFSNGHSIEWLTNKDGYTQDALQYNDNLQTEELIEKENALLVEEGCVSEKDLIQSINASIQYVRLPMKDHSFPSNEQVDFLIEWIKKIPESTWIHFHCAGGKGRTAVLLCMLDMLQHADRFSAKELMEKQTALGGSSLYLSSSEKEDSYQKDRHDFLSLFHQYCLENKDSSISWSFWLKNKQ